MVRGVLDRVYVISSRKMVEQFKRQKEEKELQENEKKRTTEKASRPRPKKSTTSKAKTGKASKPLPNRPRPMPSRASSSEDDSVVNMSLHDDSSNDSSISVDVDGGGEFGIKLPLAEQAKDDWVVVKVEKQQVSGRERV